MAATSHVFISYARRDGQVYAEKLDHLLPNLGFKTWRDKREIDPTQDFTAEIEKAIESSSHIVACITPDVRRENSFVRREIAYAQVMEKPIVVARFADVLPPIAVVNHTWIDFFQGWDAGLDRLRDLLGLPAGQYRATVPTAETHDPHRAYLEALYKQIIRFLDKTVFSIMPGHSDSALIALRSDETPDAVQPDQTLAESLPMAFFDIAGITEAQPSSFDSLHDAYRTHEGRLLLLGEPGSGKTTTLMAFARDKVAQRLADPTQPLPILAPIAAWNAETAPSIPDWLGQMIPALKNDIAQIVSEGRALLMLDGLDELGAGAEEGSDPRLKFGQLLPANNHIIVSCRVRDYETLHEKLALNGAITLRALDDGQMQTYLRDMPVLWDALRRDRQLREVARTPLLLSLFAYAFAGLDIDQESLGTLSSGALRDTIFETYVTRRYEHERRKPHAVLPHTLEQMFALLGKLAAQDVVGFFFNAPDNLIAYSDFERLLEAPQIPEFIEFSVRLNLLVPIEARVFRFTHLLLRDFFAFRYASDPHNIANYQFTFLALGRLKDPRALDLLIGFLNDPALSTYARGEAATALGWLRDGRAVAHLLPLLQDKEALRQIGAADA